MQLLEEDLADLLGRIEIERLFGNLVSLLLQFEQAQADLVRLRIQAFGIDPHAVAFDLLQHHRSRHLDLFIDETQAIGIDVRQHRVVQAQGDVGVFRRVGGGALDIDLVEPDLRGTLAAHFLEGDGLVVQVAQGQAVHVMGAVRLEHIGFEQRVVHNASQLDAVVGKHMAVVFQVLPDLGLGGIFQPGLEDGQHMLARQRFGRVLIAMRHGDVGGDAGFAAQRDADQLRAHRLERRGFGIDRSQFGGIDARQPILQLRFGQHGFIARLLRRGRCGRRFRLRCRLGFA